MFRETTMLFGWKTDTGGGLPFVLTAVQASPAYTQFFR
jgi:hypothetical protein